MKNEAVKIARRILMPIFARVNPGDVTIRHHFTSDRVRLHSFKHKGYWWYGREREAKSMDLFRQLVRPGSTVFEVGGHIGYIALYFRSLIGVDGTLVVFEPGRNNLPYLLRNVRPHPNVRVVEKGVADVPGKLTFYVEELTGQNNSFVKDFDVFRENQANAVAIKEQAVEVEVTTIDAYVESSGLVPSFLKIDVEGFEYEVLRGAAKTLERARPPLMVEVQKNHDAIFEMLSGLGYEMVNESKQRVTRGADLRSNTFAVHPERNHEAAKAIGVR